MGGRAGALVVAVLTCLGAAALGGCAKTAKVNRHVDPSSLPIFSPSLPQPTATVSIPLPPSLESSLAGSASATGTPSASITIHPAPSTPMRTATVDVSGRHYVIEIWAEVKDADCAAHAYGQVAAFLVTHPCAGLRRQLATTTVNGRAVGFDVAVLSIPGSGGANPYDNVTAFHSLVDANGTGSVNDLLREGYRLPSGPDAVPSPDAFRSLSQDTGINIYDMWYLDGPTPDNDAALEQMAQDIYLAY